MRIISTRFGQDVDVSAVVVSKLAVEMKSHGPFLIVAMGLRHIAGQGCCGPAISTSVGAGLKQRFEKICLTRYK